MKQFILIKSEDGWLQLGVESDVGYVFHDGMMEPADILSGEAGNTMKLLSLQELEERINVADGVMEEGF